MFAYIFFLQGWNAHKTIQFHTPTQYELINQLYLLKVQILWEGLKNFTIFLSFLASNWCPTMVDGAKFLISCHWLKLLRKASRWQPIQNLEPSYIMLHQCDIQIKVEDGPNNLWPSQNIWTLHSGLEQVLSPEPLVKVNEGALWFRKFCGEY